MYEVRFSVENIWVNNYNGFLMAQILNGFLLTGINTSSKLTQQPLVNGIHS